MLHEFACYASRARHALGIELPHIGSQATNVEVEQTITDSIRARSKPYAVMAPSKLIGFLYLLVMSCCRDWQVLFPTCTHCYFPAPLFTVLRYSGPCCCTPPYATFRYRPEVAEERCRLLCHPAIPMAKISGASSMPHVVR
jgi:hypothetical protein